MKQGRSELCHYALFAPLTHVRHSLATVFSLFTTLRDWEREREREVYRWSFLNKHLPSTLRVFLCPPLYSPTNPKHGLPAPTAATDLWPPARQWEAKCSSSCAPMRHTPRSNYYLMIQGLLWGETGWDHWPLSGRFHRRGLRELSLTSVASHSREHKNKKIQAV